MLSTSAHPDNGGTIRATSLESMICSAISVVGGGSFGTRNAGIMTHKIDDHRHDRQAEDKGRQWITPAQCEHSKRRKGFIILIGISQLESIRGGKAHYTPAQGRYCKIWMVVSVFPVTAQLGQLYYRSQLAWGVNMEAYLFKKQGQT